MSTTLFTGLGKRKAAVAKVYLKEGSGNFTVKQIIDKIKDLDIDIKVFVDIIFDKGAEEHIYSNI